MLRRGPMAESDDLERDLRARLGATKMLMANAPDSSTKANISAIQAAAISESTRSSTTSSLGAQAASDLMTTATGVGFTARDLSAVVESLTAATKKGADTKEKKERKERNKMQDFRSVLGFFTDVEWTAMQEAEHSREVREILFSRMFMLGARNPTEPTKRLLTSCLLTLTEDMNHPISKDKKVKTMDTLKIAWLSYVRNAQDPIEHITVLPSSPRKYAEQYPAMSANAYPNGVLPVVSKIDPSTIETLAATFNSRGNMPTLYKHDEVPILHLAGGDLHQQVQAFGNSLAVEVQRQGARQDRMLEVLMERASDKRLRCERFDNNFLMRGSRNLPIEDGRMQFKRFRSVSSELAITDGDDPEAIRRHAATAAQQALPPPLPPAATPATPPATAPSTPQLAAAPAAAAAPTAVDLLNKLEERDVQKKLQAKIAKAKAKVDEARLAKAKAHVEEDEKAKDSEREEQPKAKGKVKAKAKAKEAMSDLKVIKAKAMAAMREDPKAAKSAAKEAKSADPKAAKSAAKERAAVAKTPDKPAKAKGGHKLTPGKAAKPSLEPGRALYEVEMTRSNLQVRIPKTCGGFLNKGFRWGSPSAGRKYNNLAAAQEAANKWVAHGCMYVPP